MKHKDIQKKPSTDIKDNKTNIQFPGYPIYPADDDIYSKGHKEDTMDPEDITRTKAPNEMPGTRNEFDFTNHFTGNDLDIPGSELDDKQEDIGSEDEENNGYSLGGGDHDDLEENRSE